MGGAHNPGLLRLLLWHCSFWWDVHGLPQQFLETSVLGGLSSLSPGCEQFHWHNVPHFLWSGVLSLGWIRIKCGIVYEIQCPECPAQYVGETARTLETRMKDHLKFSTNSCGRPWTSPHQNGQCQSNSPWGQYVAIQDPWVHRNQDPLPGHQPRPGILMVTQASNLVTYLTLIRYLSHEISGMYTTWSRRESECMLRFNITYFEMSAL